MKVKVLKHCKIHGKPAAPGEVHDVHEARAKALADNAFAEPIEGFHGSESYGEMEARVQRERKMREDAPSADLTEPVEASKDPEPDPDQPSDLDTTEE